jgi:undecaprenyl-diphosphatase
VEAPATSASTVVAARNLLPIAAGGLAAYFLLAHLGQAGATATALRSTDPVWVAAALAAAAVTYVLAAVVLMAAAPVKLPLGRTVAAQLAAASANRASPAGLGGMGLNVRYLETSGTGRPAAVGTVALTSTTGFVVHLAMTIGLGLAVGRSLHFRLTPDLEASWPLFTAIVVGSTAAGAAVWFWRLHRRLLKLVHAATVGARALVRQPWRGGVLVASQASISLVYAAALTASVRAAGGHVSYVGALVVYVAGSAVGALAPTPGGLGVLEAALIAGLSQRGIVTGTAVAGVLTYRVVTYWLPVIPGLVCLAALRRRRAL